MNPLAVVCQLRKKSGAPGCFTAFALFEQPRRDAQESTTQDARHVATRRAVVNTGNDRLALSGLRNRISTAVGTDCRSGHPA